MSAGDFAGEALPGAHFADDQQFARQVGGAHSVAVAHGAGERGGVAVGGDVFGQHAAGRGVERDCFRLGGGTRGAHSFEHHGARGVERQSHVSIMTATG